MFQQEADEDVSGTKYHEKLLTQCSASIFCMQKPLKISIGMQLRTGPWGGSNQFGVALADYLRQQGADVVFDLNDADIDLILLTDPRREGMSAAYRPPQIIEYLLCKNWRAVVVHRINECDERKGTSGVNAQLMQGNRCADYTVFISEWLRTLFLRHGLPVEATSCAIFNGADPRIFHANGFHPWNHDEPLRFVTHHWGGNRFKGFDIYERVDTLLSMPFWREKIALTYIGNLPEGVRFKHITYYPGQHGQELGDALRRHHAYITASVNEPAGMHHIEGALCGLPLLYRESGALPDYCNGFGIAFTPDNFEEKLHEMLAQYDEWAERMPDYPYTAEKMCAAYYDLFCRLCEQRDTILRQRQRKRRRWLVARLWQHIRRKPSK